MLPSTYVYHHVDPRTNQVRYIGAGSRSRAWACSFSPKNEFSGRRGDRAREHHAWLLELFDLGYTMGDIVKITAQGLSREDAWAIEKRDIEACGYDNLFNKQPGVWSLVLSESQIQEIASLREKNIPYHIIAKKIGASTMTVHRAFNNKTKGYRT